MAAKMLRLPELAQVHDIYLSLSRIAPERSADSLGGKLLLRCGLDADGIAVVVAGSIAGAASLCVDADAERLRDGLRAGLVDFVVGYLDEALRILKNEIRRALPISVGLGIDPEPCIAAMIERGLQPDLLSAVARKQAHIFAERGAIALPEKASPDSETSLVQWTVAADPAHAMPRIARIASGVLDASCADTPARQRWLDESPRYLGRAFGSRQCLRMREAEISTFLSRMRSEASSAGITRDGEPT